MNNRELIFRKLTDYTLLNACSISSNGLYNGKSGMALALFEAAACLKDEYLEEQAFGLLQESLLADTKDISFESGLSGIGYFLLYLINNRLIEADFDELFGDKLQWIRKQHGKVLAQEPSATHLQSQKMLYFWHQYYIYSSDCSVVQFMQDAYETYARTILHYFTEQKEGRKPYNKTELLQAYEAHLDIGHRCKELAFNRLLLDYYMGLYNSGYWISRFTIGYVLKHISSGLPRSMDIHRMADQHLRSSIRSLAPERMSLSEQIQVLFRPIDSDDYRTKEMLLREILLSDDENLLSAHLAGCMQPKCLKAGYQSGIARLLLWMVNDLTARKRNEILRPV